MRLTSLASALALVLPLAACGGGSSGNTQFLPDLHTATVDLASPGGGDDAGTGTDDADTSGGDDLTPSGGGADLTPSGGGTCKSACDCPTGLACATGKCVMKAKPIYCCTSGMCPTGANCDFPSGMFGKCGAPAPDGGTKDAGGAKDFGGSGDMSGGGGADLAMGGGLDGTPMRQTCTKPNGTAVTLAHGRLDGFLVSTVQPGGSKACNADASHVHLQIKVKGAIYDVAVNVNDPQLVDFAERDLAMPDGAWSEGWHPGDMLDYPSLGLHAADFTPMAEAALTQKILGELMNANHLSVFATGYGPTGVHDVHRKGGGNDGAIVINPLSATSHLLFFHFSTQSF